MNEVYEDKSKKDDGDKNRRPNANMFDGICEALEALVQKCVDLVVELVTETLSFSIGSFVNMAYRKRHTSQELFEEDLSGSPDDISSEVVPSLTVLLSRFRYIAKCLPFPSSHMKSILSRVLLYLDNTFMKKIILSPFFRKQNASLLLNDLTNGFIKQCLVPWIEDVDIQVLTRMYFPRTEETCRLLLREDLSERDFRSALNLSKSDLQTLKELHQEIK